MTRSVRPTAKKAAERPIDDTADDDHWHHIGNIILQHFSHHCRI
jgi:GR25 family glycosyltransferase involved in LPS biosynthesis